jgi:hypothetical protein
VPTTKVRKIAIGFVAVAALASTAAHGSPAAAGSTPQAAVGETGRTPPGKEPARDDAGIRRLLGLDDSPEAIARARAASDQERRYHIAVRPGEARAVDERETTGRYGSVSAERLLREEPGFGGAWIDFPNNTLHFAGVHPFAAAQRERLVREAPKGATVAFAESTTALQRLLLLQQRVLDSRGQLQAEGVTVTGTSAPQPADVLTVYVPPSQLETAAGAFERVLGPDDAALLAAVSDTGTGEELSRDRATGRIYGGLWLYIQGALNCTSGIANAQSVVTAADFFVISAGHCGPAGRWAYFCSSNNPSRVQIKTVFRNKYVPGTQTSCDCMLIGPFTQSYARLSSDALVNNNNVHDYQRGGTSEDYLKGLPACISGAASVEKYGSIYCLNIFDPFASKYTSSGVQLVDQVLMEGDATMNGDSGGPWGNGRAYLGIHHGDLGVASIWSKSSNLSTLNVRLRFDLGW